MEDEGQFQPGPAQPAPIPEDTPRKLVPDPGYYEGDRSKFSDWIRAIRLYILANNITENKQKIIIVISRLRGTIPGAYAETKLEEINDENIPQFEDFVKDVSKTFGDDGVKERAQLKIEGFNQGKMNTMDFIVMFDLLKRQSKISDEHATFLLKRNTRPDIIRIILGYPPSALPDKYGEWKESILSVGKGKDFLGAGDKKTSTGVVYGGRGQPMEIGRSLPRFKDGKPKCFNCNKYGHLAKECKNAKNTKCFNCGKEGHISKDCRQPKKFRNRALGEEDEEVKNDDNDQKGFIGGSD